MTRIIRIVLILALALLASCSGGSDKPLDIDEPEQGESGESGGEEETPVVEDTIFRIATYNLLVNDGRRTEMTLDKCRDALGKALADCKADIFCFTELDATFASGLSSIANGAGVTGYEWHIAYPNKVLDAPDYLLEYYFANGIAFDPKKFSYLDGGMYWYLYSGKLASKKTDAKGNHVPKYCNLVWAELRHIPTGKKIYVVSTHLPLASDGTPDYSAGRAHYRSAQGLNSFLDKVSYPCIMGGDLNATPESGDQNLSGYSKLCEKWKDVYDALREEGTLDSYYLTYPGTMSGSSAKYYYTTQVYTKNHPERRYDHIIYINRSDYSVVPKKYSTVLRTYSVSGQQFCPSDHLPLVAEFAIRL